MKIRTFLMAAAIGLFALTAVFAAIGATVMGFFSR